MKECKACNIEKPKEEFWKNSKTSDGLQCYCKSCLREKMRISRWNNPEQFKQAQKRYWDKHKDKKRKINRASYDRFRTVKSELIKHKDKFKGISPLVDEVIAFWVSNLDKGIRKTK